MGYFISHIGVILIAGVIIALIGLAAVLMAAKNAETRSPEETDERLHACEGCAMAGLCMTMGQTPPAAAECDGKNDKTHNAKS